MQVLPAGRGMATKFPKAVVDGEVTEPITMKLEPEDETTNTTASTSARTRRKQRWGASLSVPIVHDSAGDRLKAALAQLEKVNADVAAMPQAAAETKREAQDTADAKTMLPEIGGQGAVPGDTGISAMELPGGDEEAPAAGEEEAAAMPPPPRKKSRWGNDSNGNTSPATQAGTASAAQTKRSRWDRDSEKDAVPSPLREPYF